MNNNLRRKLKRFFRPKDGSNRKFKFSLLSTKSLIALTVISVIIFCITQLVTNAILNPLGAQLGSYNYEKNQLLEENRHLEEELAEINSLKVIRTIAEKKMDLKETQNKTIIYVSNKQIHAER